MWLSASNAPSLRLWNQLSSLYNVCTLVCAMMVCLGIQKKGTRLLRSGVYLFTIMEWVSAVGFGMFPLSDSGYAGTFQDQMHILSTVIVVLLSIISLILIIMVSALGMNIVPKEYFGIVERFSVFAATGFQAVLGMHLYRMELNN